MQQHMAFDRLVPEVMILFMPAAGQQKKQQADAKKQHGGKKALGWGWDSVQQSQTLYEHVIQIYVHKTEYVYTYILNIYYK